LNNFTTNTQYMIFIQDWNFLHPRSKSNND